ncbi:MAG: hypothetical protein CMP59_11685 [Flavobacteriales bacterium]|nr:hypothetical protein [Flavobacteriales bacterium]
MIDASRYLMVGLLSLLSLVSFGQLNAEFTADTTFGCGSLGVQFTDQSTGNITSRSWSFGNTNNSTLTNPFENYSVGVYTVSLTVSDGTNSDTETKVAYIRVFSEPTADFTFTPATGCTPLPVSFTSTSTPAGGPIQTYIWDLDDGTQGPSQANFTHTYIGGGPYQPTLQVIDVNGCSDSKQSTTNITPTASPIADFTTQSTPIGCATPFNVNFVNNSIGSGLTYQWDFGDGNGSTQANPSHTYTALGNYSVQLIIVGPNCSDTITKANLVQINNTQADFTLANDTVCFGQVVDFTNLSVGATSFSWDFDDGSPFSFVKDPRHVFLDSGWFDVRLVSSLGAGCTDQITKQIYVQRVIADFALSDTFSCDLPDTIRFLNQSINADYYNWRILIREDTITNIDLIDIYNTVNPFHISRNEGLFRDTLIATSNFGCADTMVKSLRRLDTIDLRIKLTGPIGTFDNYGACAPFNISFSDTTYGPGNTFTYFWDFGNGMTFNGRTPPPRLYDTSGDFTIQLRVRNEFGCESIDDAVIRVRDQRDPAFTVSPDTVCFGDTVTIQMTNDSGSVYNFGIFTANFGSSFEEEVNNFGQFTRYLDTGYYSASVKVGLFCDTALVIDSAFYVLGPVSDPIFTGNCLNPDSVNFEARALGYTRFYWNFGDGSPIDSVNLNPVHFYSQDTVYYASLTLFNDTNGCGPKTDTIIIDLQQRLPPVRLPYDKRHCEGDSVRLYFNNTLQYVKSEWYINGNFLAEFEDTTFAYEDLPKGNSEVWLVGTNIFGCKDTVRDFLAISDVQASFIGINNTGCIPIDVQLRDSSTSSLPIIDHYWFFSDLPGDTIADTIVDRRFTFTASIDVRLQVIDENGCKSDTLIKNFIRTTNPIVDFVTNQSRDLCQGDTIQFFNRSTGIQLTSIWDWRDGQLDTNNNSFVTHQYDSAGSFNVRLIVEDATGCRDTLERYTVNVERKPVAAFTADTTQASCYPFAVNFTDTSSGNVNQWIWDLGRADSIIVQNPFRNFLQPGDYDITLIVFTPNGCSDTLTKQDYIQITGPTADFDISPDTACLNEPVNFTINSTNGVGSFRWAFGDGNSSTNDPATHIYTDTVGLIQPSLIIRDIAGNCEVFLRDTVTILDVLADFEVSDTIGCQPFSPTITNNMIGADNFSWDFGDGRTSNDQVPDLTYDQDGQFTLTLNVSNNNGCTDQYSVDITVLPSPTAVINGDNYLCAGDSLNLSGSGGTIVGWFTADTLFSLANNIAFSPDSSTSISLIVENIFNCTDTAILDVLVQQEPTYVPLEDTTIIIGEELFPNVSSGAGFSYSWTPERGLSCTDCPDPRMQPFTTTEYILTISDSLGCFSITDTILVEVVEEFTLDVPQAFSPNGDGVNDIIYVKGWGLKELIAFKIYNRFGELVFEGTEFDQGWDGTYNGKDQMVETYVYTVEAETYAGEVLTKKGNITLIR